MRLHQILLRHFPEPRRPRWVRQFVQLESPLQRHVAGQMGELDVDKFLWIEGTVPVSTRGHRFWQYYPSRVNGLEEAFQVHPPGDFADQDGRYPLWSQFFVDAEEVDLYRGFGSEKGQGKFLYWFYIILNLQNWKHIIWKIWCWNSKLRK